MEINFTSISTRTFLRENVITNHIIYLVCMLIFSNCVNKSHSTDAVEVEYVGALRSIMHEGDISSKISLTDLKDHDHLYAIGAFENLKGEIQVFDGHPLNSFVEDETVKIDSSFKNNASLLVYASIPEWTEIIIPAAVASYRDLESYISTTAKNYGIDMSSPFPFLIKGKVKKITSHVIDWVDGDTVHSHQKHMESGIQSRFKDQEVEIIGFYSNWHKTIFTHMSTFMHLHFKTADKSYAGHIDDLILGKDMILKLPLTETSN